MAWLDRLSLGQLPGVARQEPQVIERGEDFEEIEFGADGATGFDRWYGFTIDAAPTSFSLVGPYARPGEACDDGIRSVRTAAELVP